MDWWAELSGASEEAGAGPAARDSSAPTASALFDAAKQQAAETVARTALTWHGEQPAQAQMPETSDLGQQGSATPLEPQVSQPWSLPAPELEEREALPQSAAAMSYEISQNTIRRATKDAIRVAQELKTRPAQIPSETPAAPSNALAAVSEVAPPQREAHSVTAASLPATFLRRARVKVDQFVEGEGIRQHEMPAGQALNDLTDEMQAFAALTERASTQGLKTAVLTDPVFQQFDTENIFDAVAEYEARGIPQSQAEALAVSDHLADLAAERARVEREVIEQFEGFDPQRYAALNQSPMSQEAA